MKWRRAAALRCKKPRDGAAPRKDAKAPLYSSARSLPVSRPGRCGGAALRGLRPVPLPVRRVGAVAVGRRSLSLTSACPAVSASRTSAPIAAGVAGAATARSAVAKPVNNAKRVRNNRKNSPCCVRSLRYCAPFPEHRVKGAPRLGVDCSRRTAPNIPQKRNHGVDGPLMSSCHPGLYPGSKTACAALSY